MQWNALVKLGLELPGVEEAEWYRTPALMVCGKGFVRLKEDGQSAVFRLGHLSEQQALIEAQPDLYFITDHYRNRPAVLVRLASLREGAARWRLEIAWRVKAPKLLIRKFDEEG